MATRSILGALLLALATFAFADGPSPPIPNTPAGHALGSWLTAFNSGDRATIEVFTKSQAAWLSPDRIMSWRAEVGGYDLLTILSSERTELVFRVRARARPAEEIGRVMVTANDPPLITELGTYSLPPGATFIGFRVDGPTRTNLIKIARSKLTEHYVFPEVGKTMALEIAKRAKQGAYSTTDGEVLAKLLTADMRAISHDRHLQVTFRPFRLSLVSANKGAAAQRLELRECAFDKIERSPSNIGYIKFDGFVRSDACADVRTAAITFLAGVDALIFDLRENRGGDGSDTGPDLLSYLFEQPTHLSDFWDRTTDRTTQTWVQPAGRQYHGGAQPCGGRRECITRNYRRPIFPVSLRTEGSS